MGLLLGFFLQTGGGLRAAAAVCDVVWDDLLLVFAGAERGRGEAKGCGEGRPAAGSVASCLQRCQIKVVKYYDNIHFVYEIESKLRELKRANTPAAPGPEYQNNEPKENRKNDTSGQPEERQDRNYSQEYNQPVLAALRDGAPITPVLRDAVASAPPAATVALTATSTATFAATMNRRLV